MNHREEIVNAKMILDRQISTPQDAINMWMVMGRTIYAHPRIEDVDDGWETGLDIVYDRPVRGVT